MPTKTLVGHSVTALLRQAQAQLGSDAVILHVRRLRQGSGSIFEVTAADPATALTEPRPRALSLAAGADLITPPQPSRGPLVIALVGPTGAGKTTTIGKLINHPRIFGTRRVGVVGLDTFRTGAVEQLRTYARLAGTASEIAYDLDDLQRVRNALGTCEVLLIDTPGRGPRQRLDRQHLDQLIAALEPTEVHLTVAAGTPEHQVRALLKDARATPITHLLITKVDESPDESAVADVAADLELPVRWVTDGQDVPFDLSSGEAAVAGARWSRPAAIEGGAR